ncbi:outer spore coat protein CotE [Texcoconibacillus texcoconensis]|uniref:Spore coat protein E n=1 Tax=Texcoconibacillus texcoconensis TaxID=1095777 RepID=A0A840QH60_9BACI|nr:outer spore coat protein CotE [Texcoconibacillus texcoconensis]MBB5171992.1 spore coat protein E [Texcoconibacillus texcoconensis]
MSPTDKDLNYREIITKAVCGKGRKFSQASHTMSPSEKPTSILGCWIINHQYDAEKKGDAIEVNGRYDINIWYSYSNNTQTDVATETVSYTDIVPLVMHDENVLSDDLEVIARAIQQPNTLEALVEPNGYDVSVEVEREFIVEVVGETKISVYVNPDGVSDDWDEKIWDVDIEDEEFEDLDPNFLMGELEE